AAAIGNFIVIFRPEAIILGGGVAKAGSLLLEPLRQKVRESTFAAAEIGIPELRLAQAGNDAGIIGAAMLEKYGMDRRKQ
ncbi:MAG: ROK family protein, partial [Clostridia bacterium]|nr:ROK family protein [Clostridia bacterium]